MDDHVYDMNLVLFLGSGVSRPAGMDKVEELTEAVLDEDLWKGTLLSWNYRRTGNSHGRPENDPVPQIIQFLKKLRLTKADSNYEDLYHWCDLIHNPSRPEHLDFIQRVKKETESILDEASQKAKHLRSKYRLSDFGEAGKRHIEHVIRERLSKQPNVEGEGNEGRISGFNLLRELLGREDVCRLFVVTLNHDMLIEEVFNEHQLQPWYDYTDGFGKPEYQHPMAETRLRKHKSNIFFSVACRRVILIKLHGSINWFCPSEINEYVVPDGGRRAVHNCADVLDLKSDFLTGVSKELTYNSGIFADMYEAFLNALRQSNRIVMSGFGWNDPGIGLILKNWLNRDRDNKIILLHRNPDQEFQYGKRGLFPGRYTEWVERGQLITDIEKWFGEARLDELMPHIKAS